MAPNNANPAVLNAQISRGGGWFYWIAGFSLLSLLINLFGGSYFSATGLGIMQLFAGIGAASGSSGKIIALIIGLIPMGVFCAIGFFAAQGKKAAFVIGMVFYLLDALLLLTFKLWIPVAFHAFVLYRIFTGYQAAVQLAANTAAIQPGPTNPYNAPGVWPPSPQTPPTQMPPVQPPPSRTPPPPPSFRPPGS